MKLLRLTNLTRFTFCQPKLRPNLPIRNGGYLCIPRDAISRYVKNREADAQECEKEGIEIIPEVRAFKKAIYHDPILRMCYEGAINSIPKGGELHGADRDKVFRLMSSICVMPPKFEDQSITGVPFYAIFIDFLDTRYGQAFFSNPIVNKNLKHIFNAYQTMLKSKVSNKYLVADSEYGWFNPKTEKYVNWNDYYVYPDKPHWGFQNWNDWFTRKIRPEARPIAPGNNVVVNSSDSFPLNYDRSGLEGANPKRGVQAENEFWLKDNRYSLYDMFGARYSGVKDIIDKHFVGGTVYQAFLDPWCYHRWHAPVSGTVVKSYKLGGSYYLSNPGLPLSTEESYINSQPFLSIVSVRQIYIIRMDDDIKKRHVAVIEIGMAEVSSCVSTVIEGQKVKKGDQLGYFQFGGSSHAIIFDKDMDLKFTDTLKNWDDKLNQPEKQLVNSELATFK